MPIVSIILYVSGIVLLVIGYRKNNRDLMLIAAIILLLAGGLDDIGKDFLDGLRDGLR